MKEYYRIMFTDFDVMNESDWEKWNKYSSLTFNVLLTVYIAVFIIWVVSNIYFVINQ